MRPGVATDERGYIQVDEGLATNVPGIWALGDCNGRGAFTHTAYNDFEIVAANLLDGETRRVSDRILGYALYIDPPLGRVGMTDAQARASGRKLLSASRPMSRVARAIEKGETQGFMKVTVDAETQQDPRRGNSRPRRRRGHPRDPRCHECGGPVHGAAARDADPPDRLGTDPHPARGAAAGSLSAARPRALRAGTGLIRHIAPAPVQRVDKGCNQSSIGEGEMATMRAVQVARPGGPLELVERNIPEPAAGAVRVKVQACGVCHSDSVTKRASSRISPIPGCRDTKLSASLMRWGLGSGAGAPGSGSASAGTAAIAATAMLAVGATRLPARPRRLSLV